MALCQKHCPKRRKVLYYVYFFTSVVFAIFFLLAIVLLTLTDLAKQQFDNYCTANPELYPQRFTTVDSCANYLCKWTIVALSIAFAIMVPIRFACARVLKYGWLEQVERAENHESHTVQTHPLIEDRHAHTAVIGTS